MYRRRFVLYAAMLVVTSFVGYRQTTILGRVSKTEAREGGRPFAATVKNGKQIVSGQIEPGHLTEQNNQSRARTENINKGSTQLVNSTKILKHNATSPNPNPMPSYAPKTRQTIVPSKSQSQGNPSGNAGLDHSDGIVTLTNAEDTTNLVIDTIQEDQRHPPNWAKQNATKDQPYVAETLYHHGRFPISKLLLGGPAKPYLDNETNWIWPAQNESEAVCTVRKNSVGEQTLPSSIPHNLQQLLRCFSWWRMNPKQQPVLHSERKFEGEKGSSRFIREFYQGLQDVFGVRLDWVEKKGNAPSVTVPIDPARMPWLLDAYVMNSQDARTLANGFLNHYSPSNKRAGCPKEPPHTQQPKPRIGFLNRRGSRRTIWNHQEILSALAKAGFEVRYKPSFDGISMVDQIAFMSEVDILMGPHGAQFTNTLFQPECGSLLEFFNKNYYLPNFFGSLAALSGKHHFFVYNGGTAEGWDFRNARASRPFYINPDVVVNITHHMVDRWHNCCQHGFRRA